MNDNTLYTRCPTCNTAFKVTDKLLGLAGGKVRCGACLAVFQASDYMLRPSVGQKSEPEPLPDQEAAVNVAGHGLDGSPSTQPDSIEESVTKQQKPAEKETQIDLDLHADSMSDVKISEEPENSNLLSDELDVESNDGESKNDLSGFEQKELEEDVSIDSADQQTEPDGARAETVTKTEPEISEQDHSFEGFGYEDESSDFEHQSNDFDKDFIDQSENLDALSETEREFDEEQNNSGENAAEPDIDSQHNIDEHQKISNASELENHQDSDIEISEWDDDDDFEELVDGSIEQDFDRESSDEFTETTQEEFEHEIDDELVEMFDENFDDEQDDVNEEDFDELSGQLQDQMEETDTDPDPLDEFDDIAKDEKTGIKTQLIGAAIAVLVLILAYQFWSNRQALAWSNNWGSSTKAVCSFLPCNLQPKRDVSSIKLLQRLLSPDEEKENFLDIKILLINEADFDQPYPSIKIKFSNKNGEQVSLKSFLPKDYLEGDAETSLMPSGSEVHIHFKTEVTHPDALGFEFIFE